MPTASSVRRRVVSLRKLALFALNLASTLLTLFTGLRENPLVVLVSGRYDEIRTRFLDGSINYNNTNDDLLEIGSLLDLQDVGNNFRFYSQPRRGPHNFLTDRSTCLRVNSMNVTRMNIYFDDFWGKSARRTQIYMFSISAPKCDVVNFNPKWVSSCVDNHYGNETACYEQIHDNFAELKMDKTKQVGKEVDFGMPGVPFLKCRGRPERPFNLIIDMMIHQSYWAGGSWHVEVQSSNCLARPLLRDANQQYGLFHIESLDQNSVAYSAAASSGWFATLVGYIYAIVSITLIVRGVLSAVVQSTRVSYVANAQRFVKEYRVLRILFPSMTLATLLPMSDNNVVYLKGRLWMASDVWLNHWLYILMSMLDALVNMRMTYVIFQLGTYMLNLRASIETFLFMCSALGRMTWLLCLAHSITRWVFKLVARSLAAFRLVRPSTRAKIEWFVDGSSMFVSYKFYSLLLFVYMYLMLKVRKTTTFMIRSGKWGVYGVTRYKYVVNNRVMRLLQDRYVLVGWDAMVAHEALGIDPSNRELVVNENAASTNCSLGSLLQQLYTSGPSGLVHLAGDFIFQDGGFTKKHPRVHLPVKQAIAIGLLKKTDYNGASNKVTVASAPYKASPDDSAESRSRKLSRQMVYTTESTSNATEEEKVENQDGFDANRMRTNSVQMNAKSLFDRRLQLFAENRFGRLLLVDQDDSGRVERNLSTGRTEYIVQDALVFTTIMDIKPLLGTQKKLHIT
ncbi:hypothetical protein G195_004092 [Phytophthora kernoviae 00238/432]|uniref:Uncharacterized protein n=2 Tax=Phytophthora kernoviae TaxID=325452 RepID=A0A8T0M9Z3_9STRA|nr:hypothetical protein G195_004092 [Phytophthora kernoviae 00238/432]KAG2532661.1 hypothetical protein JM16_000314 [Phytophthora kernoviae]